MRLTKVYLPKAIRSEGYILTTMSQAEIKSACTAARPNTMVTLLEAIQLSTGWGPANHSVDLKASLIQACEEIEV